MNLGSGRLLGAAPIAGILQIDSCSSFTVRRTYSNSCASEPEVSSSFSSLCFVSVFDQSGSVGRETGKFTWFSWRIQCIQYTGDHKNLIIWRSFEDHLKIIGIRWSPEYLGSDRLTLKYHPQFDVCKIHKATERGLARVAIDRLVLDGSLVRELDMEEYEYGIILEDHN